MGARPHCPRLGPRRTSRVHTAIEELDNSIIDFGLVDAFPEDVKEAERHS